RAGSGASKRHRASRGAAGNVCQQADVDAVRRRDELLRAIRVDAAQAVTAEPVVGRRSRPAGRAGRLDSAGAVAGGLGRGAADGDGVPLSLAAAATTGCFLEY